ncbi:hypothetical protein I552_0978 [Mycobacterium xenopi 3993]|nr:hypothetical protein I552_0978 [Mycobacterium xenopi 3993]
MNRVTGERMSLPRRYAVAWRIARSTKAVFFVNEHSQPAISPA